jgi:uncharacterized lipoprotein YehR (DUF1307 family)
VLYVWLIEYKGYDNISGLVNNILYEDKEASIKEIFKENRSVLSLKISYVYADEKNLKKNSMPAYNSNFWV